MNQSRVSRIAWHSVVLAILTTIHHVYGAIIYNTPWRLHILMMSIPVIILTLVLEQQLRKKDGGDKCFKFWAFYFISLVPSLGMIGVFEGIYNHLLTLFPAPTYEMPNDLLFEFTGVMQGVIATVMIKGMISLTISLFKERQVV
jgi:hypothetical protein